MVSHEHNIVYSINGNGPPEQPPLWVWIIIGVLGIIAMVLLAGQTGLEIPK